MTMTISSLTRMCGFHFEPLRLVSVKKAVVFVVLQSPQIWSKKAVFNFFGNLDGLDVILSSMSSMNNNSLDEDVVVDVEVLEFEVVFKFFGIFDDHEVDLN